MKPPAERPRSAVPRLVRLASAAAVCGLALLLASCGDTRQMAKRASDKKLAFDAEDGRPALDKRVADGRAGGELEGRPADPAMPVPPGTPTSERNALDRPGDTMQNRKRGDMKMAKRHSTRRAKRSGVTGEMVPLRNRLQMPRGPSVGLPRCVPLGQWLRVGRVARRHPLPPGPSDDALGGAPRRSIQ